MKGWLANIASGLCLLLCTGIVVLCLRGLWIQDFMACFVGSTQCCIASNPHGLCSGFTGEPMFRNRRVADGLTFGSHRWGTSETVELISRRPIAVRLRDGSIRSGVIALARDTVTYAPVDPPQGWLGFQWGRAPLPLLQSRSPQLGTAVVIPCWFLLFVVCAVLPMHRIRSKLLRRRRRQQGCCLACGYDLRASQGRCPECGEPIPTPNVQSTT
ncbi:MAG TPA: hypothetical protein VHP11_04895 [Tepidisphaeraceae bacterium]|nr:hypothetical protein [Tepidisphaeraceae bacterium]